MAVQEDRAGQNSRGDKNFTFAAVTAILGNGRIANFLTILGFPVGFGSTKTTVLPNSDFNVADFRFFALNFTFRGAVGEGRRHAQNLNCPFWSNI